MRKVEIQTNPARLKSLAIGNKEFRSSHDYELSQEDVERAQLELNETEDLRNAALRTLKEMLSKDEMRYRTDDAYLLRFLRCKKFNCKEAYKMISYFYSIRKAYPHVFATLPPNFETILDSKIFTYLPYRDEDGSLIIVDKFGKWNPETHSVYDMFHFFQPTADVITMNPTCQINKIVGIIDFRGANVKHLSACLNPRTLMFWIKTWQNLFPWRIKYVLLVNCNRIVYMGLKGCKYLVKKKVADRFRIIGSDMSELHQYVNPAILPKEYGGSLEESEWTITQHIMDNLPYIQYEHSFSNA